MNLNTVRSLPDQPVSLRFAVLALALAFLLGACSSSDSTEPTAANTAEPEPLDCVIEIPEEPGMCTMDYRPVCGCDGKTYGNACMAAGAGVPSHTPGECPTDKKHSL